MTYLRAEIILEDEIPERNAPYISIVETEEDGSIVDIYPVYDLQDNSVLDAHMLKEFLKFQKITMEEFLEKAQEPSEIDGVVFSPLSHS